MNTKALKIISLILVIVSFLTIPVFASTPTDAKIQGDANFDGKLSVVDAKLILKSVAKMVSFTSEQKEIADMNADGKITVVDAKRVLKVIIGLSPDAPDPTPAPAPAPNPAPTPSKPKQEKVNLITPYENHGLGKKRMVEITAEYAETVPASTNNDNSNPKYSAFLKGTFDYVDGECTYDGEKYYILASGTKVLKKETKTFDGYVMPKNKLSSYDVESKKKSTDLVITTDWKVPYIATIKGQDYFTGYSSKPFNVSSFTGSYVDFVFRFTSKASGSFDIKNSSVVKSTKWFTNSEKGTATLRVYLKNEGKYYGYRAYYSEYNRLVLSFNETPNIDNAVVTLDAGHGGNDSGAVGANGTYEATINLKIAKYAKTYLEEKGIKVKMTRTENKSRSLDSRQLYARQSKGDMFVAIHNNSNNSSSLSGTEVYYFSPFSQPLASKVHSRLVTAWKDIYKNNSTMLNKVNPADGGVRYYAFIVTRVEECPAILVECGYLSNSTECGKLCDDNVQKKMAKAIADGIVDYYKAQK